MRRRMCNYAIYLCSYPDKDVFNFLEIGLHCLTAVKKGITKMSFNSCCSVLVYGTPLEVSKEIDRQRNTVTYDHSYYKDIGQ